MIINGIIAEYNPFHNGHLFQLSEAKTKNKADYTIVAMSSNFMQRGAPALLDKYARAKMALSCGADLILELPCCYSASSAEYFATGAVALLDKLGVVNNLCFGSERGDITILREIAEILSKEPVEYTECLRKLLQQGLSFPYARTQALIHYDPQLSEYRDVLSSPNNILGIEYIKALIKRNSSMQPYTTTRAGSNYHDKGFGEYYSSALAIRQAVFSSANTEALSMQIPPKAYEILLENLTEIAPLSSNDFSSLLHYRLLLEANKGYSDYLDVSSDLSDRILKHLYEFSSFHGFCELLKTKDITYTRISRCLLHILLDIKKSDLETYRTMDFIPYARVLGFRRDAEALLKAIKQNASIPLITKLADAEKLLSPEAYNMLKKELICSSIYESVSCQKSNIIMKNELQKPIVIV